MRFKFLRLVIVLVVFLQTQKGNCQWQTIYQDTNIYNMGVHFINVDTGFVVGVNWGANTFQQGIILKTTNGGISWDSIYTNSGNFMIEFPSESVGYTGGHDGSVMKTVNMGDTWIDMPSWCCDDYGNGCFLNNDTGIVITWDGYIMKTTNGSNSWYVDTLIGGYSPFPGIGSIQFLNDTVGMIAAGYNGIYSRTFDGGLTWQSSTIDSNMHLNTIYMLDSQNGYAIGLFGKYSCTFDGGFSWSTPISLGSYHLHDMAFFNDSIGYIVGGIDPGMNSNGIPNGVILKTHDGGNSWTVIDSSLFGYLTSIEAVNDSIGYAAGGEGLILKVTNAISLSNEEIQIENRQWNIFPNPTKDELNINSFNLEGNCDINIFNAMGQAVLHGNYSLPAKIDLKYFDNGIYLIQLFRRQGEVYSSKFIKL